MTFCYAKGGSQNRHRYMPYRFGASQRFQNVDVPRILDTHFRSQGTGDCQRKIVLIAHGTSQDLCFFKDQFGIDLSKRPNTEAVVDTQDVARSVLMTAKRPSLKLTPQNLRLDYFGLHNAAHDSRYTLRTLLMLLAKFKQQSSGNDDGVHRKKKAMSLIPPMEDIARFHKIQEGRKWCPSTRDKIAVPLDIFQEGEDSWDEVSPIMALFA